MIYNLFVTFVLPPELITSKITTLYNVCELARPDPTKTKKKQVEKVNPNIKYVHEKLFCVELEQKDIDKLESVSFGNVQGLKRCLKVKMNKMVLFLKLYLIPFGQ